MAREIADILKDKRWLTEEGLAELLEAHAQIATFANEDAFRKLISRAALETLDSLRLLRGSIERFDKSSGELVSTTNRLTKTILWIAVVVGLVQIVVALMSYRAIVVP